MIYRNIDKYNKLWKSGEINIPIIIIIGGAAGTGKTTLAEFIMPFIPYSNYLNTTLIRSILRYLLTKKEYPELYKNTYDLDPFGDPKVLIQKYKIQAMLITDHIQKYLKSIISEKQHYIIEGSNILPYNWDLNINEAITIDFFTTAPREMFAFEKMLCGPTHNRKLEKHQLPNSLIINDFIIKECKRLNKNIVTTDTPSSNCLKIIDNKIGDVLKTLSLL